VGQARKMAGRCVGDHKPEEHILRFNHYLYCLIIGYIFRVGYKLPDTFLS